jgi:cytochrome c-type biogenesis protein CcmF
MIAELGHFSLILGLVFALLLAWLPAQGVKRDQLGLMQMAKPLALGLFVFVGLSFALLVTSMVQDDFSVKYVAGHSNTDLPLLFKVSATWGAHEGSLLLWALILSGWIFAVSRFTGALSTEFVARMMSTMGLIAIGLLLFVLLTSNPFERLLDAPAQGRSLNPLLQDVGLAIHPPMLYMGYVGFVVAFAFAIASLQMGKLDPVYARWVKPWTLWAWGLLTLGIALGSWWAYYELGWGGWWFWDPVENASLLPWLVGTALIHSLTVSEKRGQFQAWTLLLAILAFSLSLLGTFLVRSGVLTSVHAFTSDPSRGVFILVFLGLVVGGSLSLYAAQAHKLSTAPRFKWLSREFALLLNNVVLVTMMATVLLGTLYPLLLDALGLGKLSVGAPYFNSVMLPLTLVLTLLMGVGLFLQWQQDTPKRLWQLLMPVVVTTLLASVLIPLLLLPEFSGMMVLGLLMVSWVGLGALWWFVQSLLQPSTPALKAVKLATFAPFIAHLGFAVMLTGIVLVSLLSVEKDLRMAVGDSYSVQDYRFVFKGVTQTQQDNYRANRGEVWVYQNDVQIAVLSPEKRTYAQQTMPMTEAGIDAGITRDLFVALGEPLADGAWSLRIQYKPFIRWIWLGAILMALGALLSSLQRRYRITISPVSEVQA